MKMRSEKEMFDLILGIAEADERIRAVRMNGSRANPNAKRDCFQDYDIGYLVNDVAPFRNNLEWIKQFGDIMILQMPTTHEGGGEENVDYFTYLTQFKDGTRIDLCVENIKDFSLENDKDEPIVLLLDKDNVMPEFPLPSDWVYRERKPTPNQYYAQTNEFWWVCNYVAKALWREQLTLAKSITEQYVRDAFMQIMGWYAGYKHDYKIVLGKARHDLKIYLSADEWERLEKTYPDYREENIWNSLFIMGDLFKEKALLLSENLGADYVYPMEYDNNVTEYLRHIRNLPKDANTIY